MERNFKEYLPKIRENMKKITENPFSIPYVPLRGKSKKKIFRYVIGCFRLIIILEKKTKTVIFTNLKLRKSNTYKN